MKIDGSIPAAYIADQLRLFASCSVEDGKAHFAMMEPHKRDMQAAVTAHRAGRIGEAQKIYEQLRKFYPANFDIVHLLGLACFQSGDLTRGGALIAEALKLNPRSAPAHNSLGSIHRAQGRLQQAKACFDRAIELNSNYPEALVNRGLVGIALGRPQAALSDFQEAQKLVPNYPAASMGRGLALKQMNRLTDALDAFNAALALAPRNPEILGNKGNVLIELGRSQEAIAVLASAIQLQPTLASHHYNLGNAYLAMDQWQDALASYDRAIGLKPDHFEAFSNRGTALSSLKRLDEALGSFDKAIGLRPGDAEVHKNRGDVLVALRRLDEALASFGRAIDLKPDYAEAYNNRGNVLGELWRLDEALASYEKAIGLKPGYAEAYHNRGSALAALKRLDEALASHDQAIALKPDYAEAYNSRGHVLSDLKRLDEALVSYDRAIRLKPDIDFLLGTRLFTKLRICDWSGLEEDVAALTAAIDKRQKAANPFLGLCIFDDPTLQLEAARILVETNYPPLAADRTARRAAAEGKIRIGYFSSDFGDHPVSFLTAELFEVHDREAFEVHAISFGPRREGEMRDRIRSASDSFTEVQGKSDSEVISLARGMGIDIAVNLNGFTQHQRTGLFQGRCAPVQVNYLGYPGTMGASYMDYLIADRVLVPESSDHHYLEKLVLLPDSFQVNDSRRRISDRVFSRSECGLPDSGVVFACHNNSTKMNPLVFDSWMRVLERVPGSVLWLYRENDLVVGNLRREAAARGIDPERLVFAGRVATSDYMARFRLADFFLDTLPFNAGTTASDALWAGLPVLTCRGNSLAGRMAASLLTALELPELIVDDMREYEDLAVALAGDPGRLSAIRQKLNRTRQTSSLFNARPFARNVEAAFREMIRRHDAGLKPDHIMVDRAGTARSA